MLKVTFFTVMQSAVKLRLIMLNVVAPLVLKSSEHCHAWNLKHANLLSCATKVLINRPQIWNIYK